MLEDICGVTNYRLPQSEEPAIPPFSNMDRDPQTSLHLALIYLLSSRMVKIEKLFTYWQELKIDLESEKSIALPFLQVSKREATLAKDWVVRHCFLDKITLTVIGQSYLLGLCHLELHRQQTDCAGGAIGRWTETRRLIC